jgi:hypothetical protein
VIPDYVTLAGCELINTSRAAAYANAINLDGIVCPPAGAPGVVRCNDCPGLGDWSAAVCGLDEGFTTPEKDRAPWVDTSRPESLELLGFVGLDIVGTKDSARGTSSRASTPSGREREITLRFLAIATSECGASYAAAWLDDRFNIACSEACSGATMCFLACCPPLTADGEPGDFERQIRSVHDLRLVEGPMFVDAVYREDVVITEFELTVATGNIGVYLPARPELTWRQNPVNWPTEQIDLTTIYEQCEPPPDCAADPSCGRGSLPRIPARPIDRCYPTTAYTAHRTLITVPANQMPNTSAVLRLQAFAGAAAMSRVGLRLWHNRYGIKCDRLQELNPCAACADLLIEYVPANGTMLLDGTARTKYVTCFGGKVEPVWIWGPMGGTFIWPEALCGSSFCVELTVAGPVAPDAQIELSLLTADGAA